MRDPRLHIAAYTALIGFYGMEVTFKYRVIQKREHLFYNIRFFDRMINNSMAFPRIFLKRR